MVHSPVHSTVHGPECSFWSIPCTNTNACSHACARRCRGLIALCSVKPRARRYAQRGINPGNAREYCTRGAEYAMQNMQKLTATTSVLQDVVEDRNVALADISNTPRSKKVSSPESYTLPSILCSLRVCLSSLNVPTVRKPAHVIQG